MPSSLIIVALAVAWLVVLVPMVARRRQEVARTTDSALASRVVRGGNQEGFQSEDAEEDFDMDDVDEFGSRDAESVSVGYQEVEPDGGTRRYRPGRGGFDPEAAAVAARAKYAFRQRIVLLMLLVAVATGVTAGLVMSVLWWAHATVDLILVGYLMYLRRQVRIEEDIRERRQARLRHAVAEEYEETEYDETGEGFYGENDDEDVGLERTAVRMSNGRPGRVASEATLIDVDDEDPTFADLDLSAHRPYSRAVGE